MNTHLNQQYRQNRERTPDEERLLGEIETVLQALYQSASAVTKFSAVLKENPQLQHLLPELRDGTVTPKIIYDLGMEAGVGCIHNPQNQFVDFELWQFQLQSIHTAETN